MWRAAVELELTGLSAGCVMGYTPSQVIRPSPQRSFEGSALLSAGCTQPSNTAAQLDETTAPAGKTRTVCASTLNFLAGFCEAATSSPCAEEATPRASDSVRYLSSHTLIHAFLWVGAKLLSEIRRQGGEQSEGRALSGIPDVPVSSGVIFDIGKVLSVICQSWHHK